MADFIEDDDRERILLLDIVSKKGLRVLTKEQLIHLQTLVERKDYGNDKKTMKSKAKLLEKISFELYNKDKGGFCV